MSWFNLESIFRKNDAPGHSISASPSPNPGRRSSTTAARPSETGTRSFLFRDMETGELGPKANHCVPLSWNRFCSIMPFLLQAQLIPGPHRA